MKVYWADRYYNKLNGKKVICIDFDNSVCLDEWPYIGPVIEDSIKEMVGVLPTVNDSGFIHHERCLTIKADSQELCIRPDAGIAYGWKPIGRENLECTDDDFRYNWDLEVDLYNQRKRHDGILYTISFNN